MKLNIRLHLVRKVKIVYPEFTIDTKDYPELEGKTLDEIRSYIEHHIQHMHAVGDRFHTLEEELKDGEKIFVLEEFPEDSRFYVQTKEDREAEDKEEEEESRGMTE